jgi:predicted membrane channel-forming protein YqfA (hemolysin III family)
MFAYDYPMMGIFWSLALLFVFVMVGFVVIYTFIDNFRRSDHSGLAKAGWALAIIVVPLVGALLYILTRPEMHNPPLPPAAA